MQPPRLPRREPGGDRNRHFLVDAHRGATVRRMNPTTAALILAAGASRRLGRPKQLVPYGDGPLLAKVVASVRSWPVDLVVVVLGAHADEILDAVEFGDAVVLLNEEWEEGMASSLRVGLDFLTRHPHVEKAFVVLGDQPEIPTDVPHALLAAAEESDRPALVPVYRWERGNPVLFRRRLWDRLMALEGDVGAAGLLKAHTDWVHEVRVDHRAPGDLDTEDDVTDLTAGRGGRRPSPPAGG